MQGIFLRILDLSINFTAESAGKLLVNLKKKKALTHVSFPVQDLIEYRIQHVLYRS